MSNKNLPLNGITDMLILHLLKQKDCYGYEITQAIPELSDRLLTIRKCPDFQRCFRDEYIIPKKPFQ
ncbi:MAG: PadR family transcriptional regulator [Acetatifactor sp.]